METRRLLTNYVFFSSATGTAVDEGETGTYWISYIGGPQTILIDYTVSGAQSDTDLPPNGQIEWTIGSGRTTSTPKYFEVNVDEIVEGDEQVTMTISRPSSGQPGDYVIGAPYPYWYSSQTITLLAQTYDSLEYTDPGDPGTSLDEKLVIEKGEQEVFDAIAILDSNNSRVTGTLVAEAKSIGGGGVIAGITATPTLDALDTSYKVTISVGNGVASGDYYVKVWLQGDPDMFILIYITVP